MFKDRAKINHVKENYIHMTNKPCVYRIWFNEYYYVGSTSNLEQRIATHIGFIKRFVGDGRITVREKKIYRKLIPLLNKPLTINITIEILFTNKALEDIKRFETNLLYKSHDCLFALNNVKKVIVNTSPAPFTDYSTLPWFSSTSQAF